MTRPSKRARHIRKMVERQRRSLGEDVGNDEQQTPSVGEEEERPRSPSAPILEDPLPDEDSTPDEELEEEQPRRLDKGKGRAVEEEEEDVDRWYPALQREKMIKEAYPRRDLGGKGLLSS